MPIPPAVLVTRPAPGDAASARAVEALGWRAIAAPALELAPLPPTPWPRAAQALLVTSAAAVRALGAEVPRGLPVHAVGEATAAAARAAGFSEVMAAGGDAEALACQVVAVLDPKAGPLWLAVGRGYGLDLAQTLRAAGFAVLRRVVYAATTARSLPEPARQALAAGEVRAALFTSPRGAEAILGLLRQGGYGPALSRIEAVAISPRVALSLSGVAWRGVRVATLPTEASLLSALGPPPTGSASANDAGQ
ncbi:uroporphyrinogen-III synthase [Humitalea rosea]|uniref:Uroporphyrinogen-III synthase n=1 Tax=Humitalea rosea TaxID=990373 RepID=A0A2W7IY34_9PROT|nr:uroporphyrinogen-III synthase [Humitalea rosea]PZW51105.1 uroporphyrinogen-III synthase [Humitalea rosea]